MEVIETNVYEFDELDDSAKEKARDWYREGALDYEWWDFVYEDAKRMGALMGIDISTIYFSGFWSQGDGACFVGTYHYRDGSVKDVIRECGNTDERLIQIARDLQAIQRKNFYRLYAAISHNGHYYHEYCTSISVNDSGRWCDEASKEAQEGVAEALREFMRWIYSNLEREYEYLMSDEQVDESIQANGYTFTAQGRRFG